jgi:hypothetical protein
VAKHAFEAAVQIVPHPHRPFMYWVQRSPGNELPLMPWCLSHTPPARCVIDHHCSGKRDKEGLAVRARVLQQALLGIEAAETAEAAAAAVKAAAVKAEAAKAAPGTASARLAVAEETATKGRRSSLLAVVASRPLKAPSKAWYCSA